MANDVDNLVLEQLRVIRPDIAELKRHAASTNVQLASMGQQIGALTTAVYGGRSDIEELRRRLDRVERRLELADD
jgi:septal ring factor EnvC (AmiA/AmiB activator)